MSCRPPGAPSSPAGLPPASPRPALTCSVSHDPARRARQIAAYNNDDDGIELDAGATDNFLCKNVALGNGDTSGEFDLQDDNANCDNNVWTQNHFQTANQACID